MEDFFKFIIRSEFLEKRNIWLHAEQYGLCWFVKGNIASRNPPQMQVKEDIKEIQRRIQLSSASLIKVQVLDLHLQLRGSTKYIWLGPLPKNISLEDKIENTCIDGEYCLNYTLNGSVLYFFSNFQLCINTNNVLEIKNIVNTLLALLLFKGFLFYPIEENGFFEADFDLDKKEILVFDTIFLNTGDRKVRDITCRSFFSDVKPISVDIFNQLLDVENLVIKNSELVERLQFYLEAENLFFDQKYSQSFIISWIILEKNLDIKWNVYLTHPSRHISKERIKKLNSPRDWSMDSILEVLNLSRKINDNEFKELMEFKRIRNKFVHEGKTISKENCEKILGFSFKILKKEINKLSIKTVITNERKDFF